MHLFAQLAHLHGYKIIEAPGRDLGLASGAVCPKLPGQTLDKWYVNCDIAGLAASYSDVYLLQDQVNTTSISEYDWLFKTAQQQAIAKNPSVQVYVELSTNYGTAGQMTSAAQSVTPNGYYVTISGSTIPQADRFFKLMQSNGY